MNNSYIPKEGFGPKGEPQCDRLTKRERFAIEALKSLMSDPENSGVSESTLSRVAVACADALIKELNR